MNFFKYNGGKKKKTAGDLFKDPINKKFKPFLNMIYFIFKKVKKSVVISVWRINCPYLAFYLLFR